MGTVKELKGLPANKKTIQLLKDEKWYPFGKGTTMEEVKTAELFNKEIDKVMKQKSPLLPKTGGNKK